MTGVAASTWHYRTKPRPRVAAVVPQSERAYRARITAEQHQVIVERITAGWSQGHSVDHSFAVAWDDGVMVASQRTWWRIAAAIEDQSARPVAPTRRQARTPRQAPVLEATGPGQVWSWDITDLRSPWRGVAHKAYSIIDVFSRKPVGHRTEDRECDDLAAEMFEEAITAHGAPQVVHADSGPAMRSNAVRDVLAPHGVTLTFIRPRVSNDNPFSESEFRTMKYRPNYPRVFETLDQAREYVDGYVPWYNAHHRHSGIALFTPDQVHDGTWADAWQQRVEVHQAYYATHPERFRTRPRTPRPPGYVGINLPAERKKELERLHSG